MVNSHESVKIVGVFSKALVLAILCSASEMPSVQANDRIRMLLAAICVLALLQCCVATQYFISTPASTTVCEGTYATFLCASQMGGVLYFLVNGNSMFRDRNITAANTQGGTINSGMLTVLGTMENDNLMISCVVLLIGSGTSNTVVTSNTSVLRVQGPPSPVTNLTYDASSATLSWSPPTDALNTTLLSYQVLVTSQSGQTLINNITMETKVSLSMPGSCGSSYHIEVRSTCGALIGMSAQVDYYQDISITELAAASVTADSITLSWAPPPGLPMNFSVVVTRDDGSYKGVFVTKATTQTVMLSTQPCGLYHIAVAAICVSDMKTTALGPVNTLNISLGTPPAVINLNGNISGTSLKVKWEVPLNSSLYLAYYVNVSLQGGMLVYSSITMETALAVALSTSANQQYRATVVPMCGSVMGAPAYLDISPVPSITPVNVITVAASSQVIGIAVGAGMGGVIVLLLVVMALVLSVMAIHKRYKGGQSESPNHQPIGFLLNIHRLLLPNKKLGPHLDVLYQDVLPTDSRVCEEQCSLKNKLSDRQQLSQSNLYTERKTMQGHNTTDGVTSPTSASIASTEDHNQYVDILDIKRKSVLIAAEPHYSTPRVHYDVPKNYKTSTSVL